MDDNLKNLIYKDLESSGYNNQAISYMLACYRDLTFYYSKEYEGINRYVEEEEQYNYEFIKVLIDKVLLEKELKLSNCVKKIVKM